MKFPRLHQGANCAFLTCGEKRFVFKMLCSLDNQYGNWVG